MVPTPTPPPPPRARARPGAVEQILHDAIDPTRAGRHAVERPPLVLAEAFPARERAQSKEDGLQGAMQVAPDRRRQPFLKMLGAASLPLRRLGARALGPLRLVDAGPPDRYGALPGEGVRERDVAVARQEAIGVVLKVQDAARAAAFDKGHHQASRHAVCRHPLPFVAFPLL